MAAPTPSAAIAELRQAITSVRAACGTDPSCRELLRQLGDVENSLHGTSYASGSDRGPESQRLQSALATAKDAVDKMFGDSEDTPASNLKEAAGVTRRMFAERRKAAK